MRTATMNRFFGRDLRHLRATLVSLTVGAFILGCGGDDSTGPPQQLPEPGQLLVTLSGGSSVGAVVLTVTGSGITSPVASGGVSLYHDLSGGTLRAAVIGTSLSGEVLRITVPDVRQVASYQVSLQQTAGNDNQPMAAGGISAEVAAVP
jgi:hypothetical protein